MSDTQGQVKDKIDDAAHSAKKATDRSAEAVKDAARNAGEAVEKAGERIKDSGK